MASGDCAPPRSHKLRVMHISVVCTGFSVACRENPSGISIPKWVMQALPSLNPRLTAAVNTRSPIAHPVGQCQAPRKSGAQLDRAWNAFKMAARLACYARSNASTPRMIQEERAHGGALTGYDMWQNASCLGSVWTYIFHTMHDRSGGLPDGMRLCRHFRGRRMAILRSPALELDAVSQVAGALQPREHIVNC